MAVRLRRVYRTPHLSPSDVNIKKACVRLRDAAITPQDYTLFETLACPSRAKDLSAEGALSLVGDNQNAEN